MRQAMADAEVGDDVLGDDPTVIRLQERMAEMLGKEAGLYVPSGSMANQVSIRSVTEPGDEIICDQTTHSFNYETGGPAALSGVSMRLIASPHGVFSAAEVEALLRPNSSHFPHSRMVIIENTNNRGGGTVWPIQRVREIRDVTKEHGLHLHLDGARLMNACTALKCKPTEFTQYVDSASMCFSKGLGAPVGSIVVGSKEFIARAHRFRKMFGGAMRQAGILAAGALFALDHNIDRLQEDHENARLLADAIAELPGIRLNPKHVQTNIVIYEVEPRLGAAEQFATRLREHGVWMFATGPQSLRAVTHLDVSRGQIERAIAVFRDLCGSSAANSPRRAAVA
jgi:threonine aldolase